MKLALMAEPSRLGNDEPRNWMARRITRRRLAAPLKAGKNDHFSPIDCCFRRFRTRARLAMASCRCIGRPVGGQWRRPACRQFRVPASGAGSSPATGAATVGRPRAASFAACRPGAPQQAPIRCALSSRHMRMGFLQQLTLVGMGPRAGGDGNRSNQRGARTITTWRPSKRASCSTLANSATSALTLSSSLVPIS